MKQMLPYSEQTSGNAPATLALLESWMGGTIEMGCLSLFFICNMGIKMAASDEHAGKTAIEGSGYSHLVTLNSSDQAQIPCVCCFEFYSRSKAGYKYHQHHHAFHGGQDLVAVVVTGPAPHFLLPSSALPSHPETIQHQGPVNPLPASPVLPSPVSELGCWDISGSKVLLPALDMPYGTVATPAPVVPS